MLLRNTELEQVDENILSSDIINNLNSELAVDIDQLELQLGDYYSKASEITSREYYEDTSKLQEVKRTFFNKEGTGKKILSEIKKYICKFLSKDSTPATIVKLVLSALSSIIPGGIIINAIVTLIVNVIINLGTNQFCNL